MHLSDAGSSRGLQASLCRRLCDCEGPRAQQKKGWGWAGASSRASGGASSLPLDLAGSSLPLGKASRDPVVLDTADRE